MKIKMLKIENLNSYYDKIHILQGVNIQINEKEFVGLIGRNGVGKTTTLKSIMHLLRKQTGSIYFNNTNLTSIEPSRIQSLGIGYVPQGRGIFPTLTVRENLEISIKKKSESKIIVDEILEQYPRLKERLNQLGGTLSGGELQILAIARCLVAKPKLLILDEPTEGIMPVLVKQIRNELIKINKMGITILLVEQNVKTALNLCDRIYIMEKGRIVHEENSNTLKHNHEVLNKFLGIESF
jgi:branched-chain amino acid transport system ATP-binding protein